jgi:hypothetical protein
MANAIPKRVAQIAAGEARVGFVPRDYTTATTDVGPRLQQSFRGLTAHAATLLAGQAPKKYAATERAGTDRYAVLDIKNDTTNAGLLRPELLAAVDELYDFAARPDFDFKSVPLFYAVIMTRAGQTALFGRSISVKHVPKENSRLVPAIFRNGVLQEVEEEIVLFDSEVDWIHYKDVFYILNRAQFERVFIDRERLQRRVTRHVKELAKTLPLSDADAFAKRVAGNLNMTVKLQRIVDRGDYASFKIVDLKAYAKRYRPEIKWQGDTIVFDPSPAHQWDILTMLDEAWFSGALSKRDYEATSKLDV